MPASEREVPVTNPDCSVCQNTRAVAEAYTMSWYCIDHGERHYNPTARIHELEAALRALADDYEALMGDGLTVDNQPAVLAQARIVLTGKPTP